jgi:hypothetical protein
LTTIFVMVVTAGLRRKLVSLFIATRCAPQALARALREHERTVWTSTCRMWFVGHVGFADARRVIPSIFLTDIFLTTQIPHIRQFSGEFQVELMT